MKKYRGSMSLKEKMELEHAQMLEVTRLQNAHATRMASMICWSIVTAILVLGITLGDKTPLTLGIVGGLAVLFGIISFSTTRSGLL